MGQALPKICVCAFLSTWSANAFVKTSVQNIIISGNEKGNNVIDPALLADGSWLAVDADGSFVVKKVDTCCNRWGFKHAAWAEAGLADLTKQFELTMTLVEPKCDNDAAHEWDIKLSGNNEYHNGFCTIRFRRGALRARVTNGEGQFVYYPQHCLEPVQYSLLFKVKAGGNREGSITIRKLNGELILTEELAGFNSDSCMVFSNKAVAPVAWVTRHAEPKWAPFTFVGAVRMTSTSTNTSSTSNTSTTTVTSTTMTSIDDGLTKDNATVPAGPGVQKNGSTIVSAMVSGSEQVGGMVAVYSTILGVAARLDVA